MVIFVQSGGPRQTVSVKTLEQAIVDCYALGANNVDGGETCNGLYNASACEDEDSGFSKTQWKIRSMEQQ